MQLLKSSPFLQNKLPKQLDSSHKTQSMALAINDDDDECRYYFFMPPSTGGAEECSNSVIGQCLQTIINEDDDNDIENGK